MGYQQLLGVGQPLASAPVVFGALGVSFDGISAYLINSSYSAPADSATGILSFWVNTATSVGFPTLFFNGSGLVLVDINAFTNFVRVQLSSQGLAQFFEVDSTSSVVTSSWINVLCSWNTNFAAGSKIGQVYINDVSASSISSDTDPAFNVGYNQATYEVANGNGIFLGALAEIYFAPGQFLDFSLTANRRLFINGSGRPVDLGATGSTPTGTQPSSYLSVRTGGAANDIATNRGTGGNFTINGTLTLSGTNP